ncbi:hypothetical protein E2K80_01580 [Rhodophyticola sp. CCM32]|uniref:hypothetical protein n=1 Tax=Rhodophyticola sp. CCM32 TaxID=2916397 RepID=UPI00107F273A|nr:hypothetical protein [Rhodophyticola sp. CCM32]QBX99573.1 hypothetical protein E2K80_01580 [Rhodophyticola sp. CCM32]
MSGFAQQMIAPVEQSSEQRAAPRHGGSTMSMNGPAALSCEKRAAPRGWMDFAAFGADPAGRAAPRTPRDIFEAEKGGRI